MNPTPAPVPRVTEHTFSLDWDQRRLMRGHIIVAFLAGSTFNPAIRAGVEALVKRHAAYPRLVAMLNRILGNPEARIGGHIRAEAITLLRELGEMK